MLFLRMYQVCSDTVSVCARVGILPRVVSGQCTAIAPSPTRLLDVSTSTGIFSSRPAQLWNATSWRLESEHSSGTSFGGILKGQQIVD